MSTNSSIKHISLKHGWFYHFRIHDPKLNSLCDENNFSSLKDFMNTVFCNCPDHYFHCGPRGSALRFKLDVDLAVVAGHEVSQLASIALNSGRYKTAHSNVQVHMLESDPKTIGVEVPLWLLSHEIKQYHSLFDTDDPLTGHIDVLRIDDGNVWIWDFKPDAIRERFASTQTYFYALMLSKRTKLPLSRFRCGYFDENTAHIFNPAKVNLNKISSSSVGSREELMIKLTH